ncbi:Ubiquitin family [Trypanosoma brucei equiperdum]|uniref:Ubiquitin family n=1 Tax=Trypanosoma brucei equiperdum TaxID=630700 RepID=A0A3L6L9W7_9TRYP|nr:Ubiquitin family [Trypanosoma brucei equiperdum]
MRRGALSLLKAGLLGHYQQEAFEARKRFEESTTYPGPIRAATPGDTRFYSGSLESILHDTDRHYWRAVTDDPRVQHLIPLRIRFKIFTWVTSGWEQRMQVVQIMAPKDSTIAQVKDLVIVENQSPYLCVSSFHLAIDGKELDPQKTLGEYGITEQSQIDAIEQNDHLLHRDDERPRDWTVDEITAEDVKRSPYKEMEMQLLQNLAPRYEARPKGYFGRTYYSGMKQSS